LVYDPEGSDTNRESIVIKLQSWADISLEDFKLRVNNRTTKLYYPELNNSAIITEGNQQIFTWNYRFPNTKATCVSLIKDGNTYTTYCYNPNELSTETWNIETESRKNYIIKIKKIIYDPVGSDKNNETITLQILSWYDIDLSEFRLWVGTSTRKIAWILNQWEPQTFKWNYRFPNTKPTCVSLFRENTIFDTLCYDPADDKEELEIKPVPPIDYVDYKIQIQNIDYDPPWSDKDNEKITIVYSHGSWDLDLTDNFYLQRWKTRRSLKKYWTIKIWAIETLIWTFSFPNSKNICVELVREDLVFDKYCYEADSKPEDPITTGTIQDLDDKFIPNLQIISILPNPVWKDINKEFISLYYTNHNSDQIIDLQDNYYLIIGSTKKYFKTGIILPNQEKQIFQNFSFPNKATCVELRKDKSQLDKFCYTKPEEWQKFLENNWILESISTIDLSILNKIKIKKFADQYCLSYQNQKILCKKLPKTKSRTSMEKLNSAYISALHRYLAENRPVIYNKTAVHYYKTMFSQAKKILKTKKEIVTIKWEEISIYNFDLRFHREYEKSTSSYIIDKWLNLLFTKKILNKYYQLKKQFYKYLYVKWNNSKI